MPAGAHSVDVESAIPGHHGNESRTDTPNVALKCTGKPVKNSAGEIPAVA
jgi:hypothetical protein